MMQNMGQKNLPELQPTLEINPDHEIIRVTGKTYCHYSLTSF